MSRTTELFEPADTLSGRVLSSLGDYALRAEVERQELQRTTPMNHTNLLQ